MRGAVAAVLPLAACGAAALAACGTATGGVRGPGAAWPADERVLITDFSSVQALARGADRVFAATRGGLVIYDEIGRRFELPITREDGYPVVDVTAMVHDDRDRSIWLATADGRLHQFDPSARRFVDVVAVGAPVLELAQAGAGTSDLFLRTAREWRRFDTFTHLTEPASAAVVAEARRGQAAWRRRAELLADPGFQSLTGLIGRSPGGAPAPVVDVVAAREPNRFWVATDGSFLFTYDHLTRQWSPVVYGFQGRGAVAVVAGAGGLWFAPGETLGGRFCLVRADARLQHWDRWLADSARSVPGPGVRALMPADGGLWAAGAGGLYRFELESGEWSPVADGLDLAVGELTALAAGPDGGVWVGTDRGVLLITPSGQTILRAGPTAERVDALLAHGDALWIGTPGGLFVAGSGAAQAATPSRGAPAPETEAAREGAREDAQERSLTLAPARPAGTGPLRRPARALAAEGDILYAGLGQEVWRRRPGADWERVNGIGRLAGDVTALAVEAGVVWAGSAEGVVRWDESAGEVERYTFAAGDLPTASGERHVFDVLPAGSREVWVATPAGAIRLSPRR